MKKIAIILSLFIAFTACKNETKQEKKETKQEVKPEKKADTRAADISKTKFVLFESDYDPKKTYMKMKDYLESKGMFYPKLVDHQTAAKNANIELKPIYLVIFGNPKMGSFLMQENPEVGIELPLKALIYQDTEGKTWVMYKDMNYLKDLYFVKDPNGVIEKMNNLQAGFKQAVYNPIKTSQITDEEIE